jgi:DNA primase catalytic core
MSKGENTSLSQVKDLVKDRIDLADVVSKHTRLVKTGSGFKACCPLPGHREKTPSFHIDRQKNLYYCYGCQRGGDVFNFLQLVEGLNFIEALKELAESLQIELPKLSKGELTNLQVQKSQMDEGFDVLKRAAQYYHRVLIDRKTPEAVACWEYLINKRGLTEQEILDLELGYAPSGGQALSAKLNGTPLAAVAEKLGLIRETRFGSRDFFQSRLVIPILDFRGKVRGFSGRVLDPAPEDQPKYKNSQESDWFKKKELLYGLDRASKFIRENGFVCIVEGYFDQWAFDRNQIPSVAAMGVALTEEHLRTLQRFSKKIFLVMDADRAGIESTKKALPVLMRDGWDARVFSELAGKDPDEWLHEFKGKSEDVLNALNNSLEASEWWVHQILKEARQQNENRLQTLRRMKEVWACASDSAHKSILADLISRQLGIGRDEVRTAMEDKSAGSGAVAALPNQNLEYRPTSPRNAASEVPEEVYRPKQDRILSKNSWDKAAEELLVWWIRHWALLSPTDESSWVQRTELFRGSLAESLIHELFNVWKAVGSVEVSFLARKLEDEKAEPLLKHWIFRGLVAPDEGSIVGVQDADKSLNSFKELAIGLKRERIRSEISQLDSELRTLWENDPKMMTLLSEIQKLRFCLEDRS